MKLRSLVSIFGVLSVGVFISGQAANITYTADTGVIANPERGKWSFNSNNFGSQGLPSPISGMLN